ncbi:MAG: hypothetical protein LBE13_11470, partial [Bacteroidales bacterium]|nr:hypothetical protein [Bacteroidales bacterium]
IASEHQLAFPNDSFEVALFCVSARATSPNSKMLKVKYTEQLYFGKDIYVLTTHSGQKAF